LNSSQPTDVHLGFLTAVEFPGRGHVAGLLITNRYSRPLEFQCTSPVKPNRTQELLYGPTLLPFIRGELLGRPLIQKAGVKPHLVVTDCPDMLALREHVSVPVVCVDPRAAGESQPVSFADAEKCAASTDLQDRPLAAAGEPDIWEIRGCRLRIDSSHQQDRQLVAQYADRIPVQTDLWEPLDRVREALKEAAAGASGGSR